MRWLILILAFIALALTLCRIAVKWAERQVLGSNATGESAASHLARILTEAELGQYVPLPEVDAGHMRSIRIDRFIAPPPGESVVVVGDFSAAQHAISMLKLNPARVTVAEYPWRLFNLPSGMRIIILPSALELPQIEGVLINLRALGDAHYVRLVV